MKYGIKFIENQKMKEGNFLIMEKLNKTLKNSEKAITLIALVVTIIVLLILAGVSISMLTGENGILSRGTQASQETVHANVYEQLQLKVADYFVEKNLGNTTEETLIEYLREEPNPILEAELGEGSGKYQINVENLLGTEQKYGNGTATGSDTSTYKDVYMLETEEPEDPESGSIVNTKVATTMPVKIASTTASKITYIVRYYENANSEELTLGKLYDNDSQVVADDSEKLEAYFKSADSYDSNGNLVDNDTIGVKASDLYNICTIFVNPNSTIVYDLYNGSVYKLEYPSVTKIESNFNLNKFGEYTVDGINILVDSNQCTYQKQDVDSVGKLDWGYYMAISGSPYYYTIEGEPDRPFIGYIAKKCDFVNDIYETIYYDINGNIVDNIVDTRPM